MKDYLKVFDVILKTKAPVFIGSGKEFLKKEYIFQKEKKQIIIPKLEKMYMDLCTLHKQKSYEDFLIKQNRIDLATWIKEQSISQDYVEKWKLYELDCGDAIIEKGNRMQIMSFIKDVYGNPYIPGSSIKGMLRTILLAYNIENNPQRYKSIQRNIEEAMKVRSNRKKFLARETKALEAEAFNQLGRSERKMDAVNDVMTGIIVSDSQPLSVENLTLCQKIEYHVEGSEKRLNLLRECLKPETEIKFTISIDTTLCSFSEADIMKAIEQFTNTYYEYYLAKFKGMDRPTKRTVWLGGGVGYVSKTITYPLFKNDGVAIISQIFQGTGVPREHKHYMDTRLGVSPHVCKCTRYKGKKYQFGECILTMKEK